MTMALDHVVIVVASLEQAVADYQRAGFTVIAGGRHPGRNTANALVVFEDDSYLELIAYSAPSPEERWWRVLDAAGEGLVDFALWPQDIDAAVAEARARGLAELTAVPGARNRPDGVRIAWSSARQQRHDLPFLCADITPRALRVPEGEIRRHANGARGVAAVQVAVQDVAASLARYRMLLGPDAVTDDGSVQLQGFRVELHAQPGRARGEGPASITLAGAAPGLRIDPALTHGAVFRG
ncbi:VOC family protein [Variovorax soli]|uniref:VOC family protein n=1 Tax=Variovorax soli TaxID=376815 RepID=UPI000838A3C5|nr:VOC family protein [Variovorax soli]